MRALVFEHFQQASRCIVSALREAPFLTGERVCRMTRASTIGAAVSVLALIMIAHGGNDPTGVTPGGDFVVYWVAARLAAAGQATTAYAPQLMAVMEHRTIAMPATAFLPFYYPPVWLVVLLPFAALPYVAAWLMFSITTGLVFLIAVRRLSGARLAPGFWFAVAGFPGLLLNAGSGQNGFLTGACFAAYGALLNRCPFLAGMSLGLLCLKPQLSIAVPVALLAARRMRPLAGAVFAGVSFVAVSVALFGLAPWKAFVATMPAARSMLETGLFFPFKTAAVLGSLRIIGVPGRLAYVMQIVVSLIVMIMLAVQTARRPGALIEAALLALSALLVTPYATDYDLTISAVGIVALFSVAQSGGFLPWEKSVLTAAYILPLLGPATARGLGLPIIPVVLAGLFAATVRRARLAVFSTV